LFSRADRVTSGFLYNSTVLFLRTEAMISEATPVASIDRFLKPLPYDPSLCIASIIEYPAARISYNNTQIQTPDFTLLSNVMMCHVTSFDFSHFASLHCQATLAHGDLH
jgi:hypothetical protein